MAIDEKLLEQANSARVLHMAEQFIFPFLKQRVALEAMTMSHAFKAGKSCDHHVAFITALIDLEAELTQLIKKGDRAATIVADQTNS